MESSLKETPPAEALLCMAKWGWKSHFPSDLMICRTKRTVVSVCAFEFGWKSIKGNKGLRIGLFSYFPCVSFSLILFPSVVNSRIPYESSNSFMRLILLFDFSLFSSKLWCSNSFPILVNLHSLPLCWCWWIQSSVVVVAELIGHFDGLGVTEFHFIRTQYHNLRIVNIYHWNECHYSCLQTFLVKSERKRQADHFPN